MFTMYYLVTVTVSSEFSEVGAITIAASWVTNSVAVVHRAYLCINSTLTSHFLGFD